MSLYHLLNCIAMLFAPVCSIDLSLFLLFHNYTNIFRWSLARGYTWPLLFFIYVNDIAIVPGYIFSYCFQTTPICSCVVKSTYLWSQKFSSGIELFELIMFNNMSLNITNKQCMSLMDRGVVIRSRAFWSVDPLYWISRQNGWPIFIMGFTHRLYFTKHQ